MKASYFFSLAKRCLSAADECLDRRAKEEFQQIAEELIRKANELDGTKADIDDTSSANQLRRLHS
jgi:hypothetical protein